jgi:hypothetical protein
MGQGLDGAEGLTHRSNGWKFKKNCEHIFCIVAIGNMTVGSI